MSELLDCKDVSHPFDREDQVSLDHLYKCLCNHVTLGQWELARVCLTTLYDRRKLLKKPLKEIVRAVIDQPMLASNGSPSVTSPLQLSWLCFLEYLDLFTSHEDKLPAPVAHTVEFRFLLYLTCTTAPKQVIQELDEYYCQKVYGDTASFKDDTSLLSTSALHYLHSLLEEHPEFGHAIISQLTSQTKHSLQNNHNLQLLYINSINKCLDTLEGFGNSMKGVGLRLDPMEEVAKIQQTKKHLYQLLSFLNPTPDMLSLPYTLDSLFEKLIVQSKLPGLVCIQKGVLYSCLLQRPTTFLIQKFCEVENRLRFSCDLDEQERLSASSPVVCPAVRVCLFQSHLTDRAEAWRYLYFHALHQNHVMENVVESALLFVKDGDFNQVMQLLDQPEFGMLKPLVLLLGWPYCYSCENARNLLDALWDPKAQVTHPLLYQACKKLAYQVQLVQWCLEKAGLLLASNDTGSTHHQQASEMFQGLESHSVLRVLHKSISLAKLPEKEVFALLRKRPVFSLLSEPTCTSQDTSKDSSKEYIVENQSKRTEFSFSSHEEHSESQCIHPEVERDIILYHSFCAMKSFMDCVSCDEANAMPTCVSNRGSKNPGDCSFLTKLQRGRHHLSSVYPLTFRTEILENIFSLLFATYEDLYSENIHHESDTGLDTGDDETKSINTSLTGSVESLVSIASADVGLSSPFKTEEDHTLLVSTSAPESPVRVKGHTRHGSRGNKKQLFQSAKTDAVPGLAAPNQGEFNDQQAALPDIPLPKQESYFKKKMNFDMEYQTREDPRIGFIVNDEIVPEYLKTLKDCLMDLNAAKILEKQTGKPLIRDHPDWLITSVACSTLEQRISRLGQYIVEAQWRCQLVSWTETKNNKDRHERGSKGGRVFRQILWRFVVEEEQPTKNGDDKQTERKRDNIPGKASDDTDGHSDESSSYQSQELTTGTEDSTCPSKLRKKLSKKLCHGRRSSASEGLVIKDDSIVSRMLSSCDTLIFMCLRKDSYDRAHQVIKMFQLHDKPSAQAAIFAEKFSNAFKELSKLQPLAQQRQSRRNSTSRTLGAVAMAAASGVTSSVVSNLIDELLTSPNVSTILLDDVEPGDEGVRKSSLYRYVDPDLIPVMVCLDLACTANVSWEVCKNILETAKSRLVQEEDIAAKSESCLVGVWCIVADLYKLLLPTTSQDRNSEAAILQSTKLNLVELLSGMQSLQIKSRNSCIKREKEQQLSIKRMEETLEDGDTAIIAVKEATSKRSRSANKPCDSRASFTLVEKSLSVRVAITELQNSFNCTVDHGTHRPCGVERLDYLRSLVNHVDTLATLLLHWQTESDDIMTASEVGRGVLMKVTNPFVVLNKGVSETLGKPMFEKNVSPKSVEGVCKQLNINLVKVIVHNCCQHIPSSGVTSDTGGCWPSSLPVVLNESSHWSDKAREPNLVVKQLLTKMIDLLTDIAKKNDGVVDSRGAEVAIRSSQFNSIVQGTAELPKLDLDLLQTSDSKLCFFINVLNLLFTHASLLHFSTSEDEEDWNPRVRQSYDMGKPRGVSALDRISFLKHHCYSIGQLGPTSAFDILFMILRSGMFPPTMFGPAIQLCYPERLVEDPKRKYKPAHPDKRIIFAVSDGCISSPDLQVYEVKELDAQLNAAAMAYINPHVAINAGLGKVVLPELIYWYHNDFNQGPFADLEAVNSTTTQKSNINFLLLLEPYLDDNKAAQLQSVLPNITEITYKPFCWKFGYRFEVSSLDNTSMSGSSLRISNSISDSLHLSLELSCTPSTGSIESRGKFHPNQTTLEYLSKASSLVSTLIELICSSKSSTKSVSQDKLQSAISQESCFNFVLKRTANFSALQRYFATRFYCISEFLTMTTGEAEFSGSYELVRWEAKPLKEDNIDAAPKILFFPLALSAEDSPELQYAHRIISDFFLRQGNFESLLELMKHSSFHCDGSCGDAMDYLLTSAILSKGSKGGMLPKRLDALLNDLNLPPVGFTHRWHKKPWSLLAQIKDNDHLSQLVLSRMKECKAKDGLDLLNLALSRPPKNTALRKELEHRKKELNLHVKISRCAKAPQLRTVDTTDNLQSPLILTRWQGVASTTLDDPNHVMEFLLSIEQYELAGEWAELHALPSEYHKIIKESHLKHLLDSSPEDTMKAYRILEGIQEQHMALEVCQSLLLQNLHVSQTLFIIQFMLTNLHPHLSPLRTEELLLTKMGAKALLCIPDMARSSYEHLVSRPHLLLEQLLMNLKVEWAAQVFSRLQVDLALMGDDVIEGKRHHECTVKAFDDLLAKYAAKALEFQVVQPESSPEITMNFAAQGTLSSSPSSLSNSGRQTPTPGHQIPASKTSLEYSRSISSIASDTRLKTYVPPAIPPRKEEWMPDAQALNCIICNEAFSMFNRRHHCRRCGLVVCSTCSRHSSIVQGYGDTPVRVCDSCHDKYDDKIHKDAFQVAPNSSPPSKSPAHPGASSLDKSIAHESVVGSYGTSPYATELQAESKAANKWRLTLDPESNATLREEFYYEQAPSSSLCIAILDLHSDNSVCGQLLLDLCNILSKKLVPITPGVRNDEVDHNLIISMIRYLLFNAKLKMIKAGETHGLELCDTYLGHVDLMKFLVESNCGDIPSLQDLTHPDSARRLRDRFIEDERLTLAMEVSTKCGLEPSSVWAAAGFACLQGGDLASAREKFAKCMKSTDGKHQQHSQYLDKVIDILQTSPLVSFTQLTDEILSPLRGLAEHCKNSAHGSVLDSKRFDECLYYLHAYGNDALIVAFYGRHGHLRLACRYILDKKSHPDVFVESLLMRLISKGSVSALKEQMEAADPSLQLWIPYLTAACRFLHKRGYLHLLHDLQLFMKDYFRAAQTCVRFFEGTAGGTVMSYEDLYSRLHYLNKARSHIEAVIIEKKSPRASVLSATSWLRSHHGNLRRKSASEEMQHVTITLSELTNHVNTINLQVEVTNFLHKSYLDGGNVTGLRARDDGKLPTLFGNGHAKAELAIQVLLSGLSIQDGFSLAARIIQDYNLPASRVYVDAGRALARQYRFNHIQQLLKCVVDMGVVSDRCHDDIILACVRIVSTDQTQAKHVENLIKLLKSDSNKIDAFLLCGKLRSAYLIAVKEKNSEAVQMIAEEAQKTGQVKTLNLCTKWLAQKQKITETVEKVAGARGQGSRRQ